MDYLEFVYYEREIFLAFLKCVEPFIALRNKIDCLHNFLWTIKRHMRN